MRLETTATTAARDRRPWLRGLLTGLLAASLAWGSGVAHADDLTDAQTRVRKAIVSTRQEISAAKEAVLTAEQRLEQSQAELARARAELEYVNGRLAAARAEDQRIAAALVDAEKRYKAAGEAVEAGESDVAEQRRLIGVAARTAYQQQTPLVSLGVALNAETPADMAQRLQWSDTIFDATAAEMQRLEDLLIQLEAAKKARAEAAAKLREQRRISRNHLAATQALAGEASARQASVASLVAANAQDKAEAESDLLADERSYQKLQAQDRDIQAQIKARIAAQKRAEAAARAKARALARAAAKAKAAAKAAAKPKVTAPSASSSKGFSYPINARPGSPFGMRYHPILRYWRMHWGTDFGAPCGTRLYAVADGTVASARWQGGFGNYVVIDHGKVGGKYLSSGYAHQSKMAVRAGQKVRQGQVIGYVGTTGLSTGCHLHFQIYANGTPVNPMAYL